MSARSYSRGHAIIFRGRQWVYEDNETLVRDERECISCGNLPTPEGYDACLGHIEGATSACCGHGASEPIKI